jgi:hypothetical protein
MTHRTRFQGFTYDLGEEVVVRLDNARLVTFAGPPVAMPLPRWTIAEVAARYAIGGRTRYEVTFRLAGRRCSTLVEEEAIEGTA